MLASGSGVRVSGLLSGGGWRLAPVGKGVVERIYILTSRELSLLQNEDSVTKLEIEKRVEGQKANKQDYITYQNFLECCIHHRLTIQGITHTARIS